MLLNVSLYIYNYLFVYFINLQTFKLQQDNLIESLAKQDLKQSNFQECSFSR